MTNFPSTRRTRGREKRERLIAAATGLMHRQGIEATTLADIAEEADVPLGNVYYYFKTKDDVVRAVIEQHAQEVIGVLEALDELPAPKDRLIGLVDSLVDQRDAIVRSGCPMGSLCSELGKRDKGIEQPAADLLRLGMEWSRRQFAAMGREDAQELAVALSASYQGIALLTNALGDPGLLTAEAERLKAWIAALDE